MLGVEATTYLSETAVYSTEMPRSRPIEVLHVDDEPGYGELAEEFLPRAGELIQVTTALSADEGMAFLEDATVDCIVSD